MPAELTAMQLHEIATLVRAGAKQSQLAPRYGVTCSKLCRLLQRFDEQGSAEAATVKRYVTGPRDEHVLTEGESAALRSGYLQKRSLRLAVHYLLEHPDCEHETAIRLSAVLDAAADKAAEPVWPMWLRRLSILTDEEKLGWKGKRALMRVEPARPRGRFYLECRADGSEIQHPLFPGAVFKSDDQSENTPSVEIDPETGLARVNRQTLFTVDGDAACLLGFSSIARVKDVYTLEDQADHVLEIVDAHGMPLRWMIERGPWDNDFWWGVKMPKDWWETEDCPKYRFGGIDTSAGGPIGVMQAFKPRHKAEIEGAFNHLQNLNAHTSLDMGRYRGEFEAVAKRLARLQSLKNPERVARAAAAFPDQAARADMTAEVMRRFNAEAKERSTHGGQRLVPAELWAQAQTRPLTDEHRWRFLPVKKTFTVRQGHISCCLEQHKGRSFLFTAEGVKIDWDYTPWLPSGWRVFGVFHPHRLDLGCRIFNAVHPNHPKNQGRFPLGMPLGVLPAAELAPQWREGDGDTSGDFAGRREWHQQVSRQTRIYKESAKKSVRASFSATRQGQAVSARRGSADPLNAISLNLDSGAPPVMPDVETGRFGDREMSRSGVDHLAGSGYAAGRGGEDHEAQRNIAGRLPVSKFPRLPASRSPSLAELEAASAAHLAALEAMEAAL